METLETIDGRGILLVPPEGQSNRVNRNFFGKSSKTEKVIHDHFFYRSHKAKKETIIFFFLQKSIAAV